MKLRIFAALIAAALGGCVTTPEESPEQIRAARTSKLFTSLQTPRAVVDCLTRNHRAHIGDRITPAVTEMANGSLELSLRMLYEQRNMLVFYAVITPTASGSDIRAYRLHAYQRDAIEPGMLNGC